MSCVSEPGNLDCLPSYTDTDTDTDTDAVPDLVPSADLVRQLPPSVLDPSLSPELLSRIRQEPQWTRSPKMFII